VSFCVFLCFSVALLFCVALLFRVFCGPSCCSVFFCGPPVLFCVFLWPVFFCGPESAPSVERPTISMSLVAAFFLVVTCAATAQEPAAGGECESWQRCRALALEAAERREYEVFHDLAWRAVQKGPKNDADLMTMLARAQSLSGRPHDALVMLHRLAAMGIATDAATSEDFRRVRSLAGWEAQDRGDRDKAGAVTLRNNDDRA
jgi:hypothetical protein